MEKLLIGTSFFLLARPITLILILLFFLIEFYIPKKQHNITSNINIFVNEIVMYICLIATIFLFSINSGYILSIVGVYFIYRIILRKVHKVGYLNLICTITFLISIGALYFVFNVEDYEIISYEMLYAVRLILFFVITGKPINFYFKAFFGKFQVSNQINSTISGAGAVIGLLERILIALFLLLNQYAAIGLVFTAKSVARYNKISEDQAFAEYYLIGSLFSMISVVIVYLLLYF